ncbi:hypothetical protein H4R18_001224 [Coemansia javaensis]|uniref:Kinesin-like protein n=1 Tax=Coemansia javaensis TaxID=2761396 RepID=A0A9W8LJG5_9FUNG|nr:hypothetical protein H4R18_001224 [Coemansia javaensis]
MGEHKNVVVAVRCRPLNAREAKRGAQCLVSMDGQQTRLAEPEDSSSGQRRERTYTFDHCYWSAGDPGGPRHAGQEAVFNDIGRAVLGHALSGYHCAILAYGQTSSGKTYTMMGGSGADAGLIPRIAQELFVRIADECAQSAAAVSFHVEVSYLEIYNERVRDLLNPLAAAGGLRVREHPSLGPYVEDLTKAAVSSYAEVLEHMVQGNRARTVAATDMNAASSRSHAVFTIVVARRTHSAQTPGQATERVSRISLVDLAGSERASSTLATGQRLREGARINQSLAALGKVISALAAQERRPAPRLAPQSPQPQSLPPQPPQAAATPGFVPYRDSVLTWLLKDSLGGNSRTFMIATVSPADYGETLSTLRYADRAKHIVNVATVNEDATVKLVRQLQDEIAELRRRLELAEPASAPVGSEPLEDQLAANEKLIAELNQSWEEKLRRTQALQQEREHALAALGIAVDTNGQGLGVGLHAPRDIPHLVNLSEDPLMSECLVYNLKPGTTVVGSAPSADIRLGASGGVAPRHCLFVCAAEALSVHPVDGNLVMVNGRRIFGPRDLRSGYRVIIGSSFVFRLNHPLQARLDRLRQAEQQEQQEQQQQQQQRLLEPPDPSSDEQAGEGTLADWHYAWDEVHPDCSALVDLPGAGLPDDYGPAPSVSTWSDTQSEASDAHDALPPAASAAAPARFPALASAAPARPMSQLSFRRTAALSPRPRRGSAFSEAGGLALLQDPAVPIQQRRRARGQTTSASLAPLLPPPPSPLMGGSRPARRAPQPQISAQINPQISAHLRPLRLETSEARERLFYERRLARLVLRQWRRYKLVRVGETILRNAIHIKEANVIGKELGQKAVYQFAIVRGGADAFPVSPLEPDALPALLSEDWDAISSSGGMAGSPVHSLAPCRIKALDNPASEGTVPEVVVKVLDIAHACWYVWSLDAFHDRLDKMRRLSTVKGSYRAHLVLDPFHANPAPVYSCIGAATYPIWPGARPYSARIDAPVIDGLSGLERGRTTGSLAALPVRPAAAGHVRAWNVIVHVKALHGVSEAELTAVHCRLRLVRIPGLLSSTRANRPLISPILAPQPDSSPNTAAAAASSAGAADAPASPVLVSASLEQAARVNRPIAGFGNGPVNVQFRQQWTVDMLTEDTCVVIEFFGRAQPLALRRAFHEDVQIEESLRGRQPRGGAGADPAGPAPAGPLSASQSLLVERLHEEELFVDSQHELVMWVRVLELGPDGAWERAPCSGAPAFLLRQGVQRRIEIVVGHSASQNLRICGVAELHAGGPQLVDAKGRLAGHAAEPARRAMAALPVTHVTLADENARVDNRCFVAVTAAWDTSVYGSRLLDLPTERGMRVRLALHLALAIENGQGTLDLATDMYVEVCSRQSLVGRRSWLAQLTDAAAGLLRSSVGVGGSGSGSGSGAVLSPEPAPQSPAQPGDAYPPLDDPVFRVFSVTLAPVGPSRGKESLWRLNTGKKYVRGEETLLPWQPRSVRFVDEYHAMECSEAWRLVVARSRERLEELGPELRPLGDDEARELRRAALGLADQDQDQDQDLSEPPCSPTELTPRQQRARQLAQEAVRRLQAFRRVPSCALNLEQEPLQAALEAAEPPGAQPSPTLSLAALRGLVRRAPRAVRPIAMQGHFSRRGWLEVLDTNAAGADSWARRWCVVERPYLFVFRDRACHHLDNVVNISSARIAQSPHVAQMVGRDNVLALYTNTNAYLLSPPPDQIQDWISSMDEWFFLL